MNNYESLTLLGIILSPAIAVVITLVTEHFRRRREGKRTILQTLLATRGRYADPGYTWAIRSVQLEFADSPKVLAAFDAYMHQVRHSPRLEYQETHNRESGRREGLLISEMLKNLGYRGLSSEQVESYTAQGLATRDELVERALRAIAQLPVVADRSAVAAETMVSRLQQPQL